MKVQDPTWGTHRQNRLRSCGRFAALATDDTESIGNSSDDCAVESTTGCREFLPRRRRRLRITWQEREPTTCAPAQVEPDSHEERLARVRQLVRTPRLRMAPGLREVRAATQVFRHLAERVGPVDPQGEVPRAIRRQHWSVGQLLVETGNVH